MAVNWNANSALLLLWPWATYFFLRSIETGKGVHGAAFGGLAAAAMLTKYYSAIFLASCCLAAIAHPERRRILASPAPWCAVVVGACLIAPHAWWLASGGLSLSYAGDRFGFTAPVLAWKAAITGVQGLLFFALPVAALMSVLGPANGLTVLRRGFTNPGRRDTWIAALAFGPYLLTLVAGTVGTVKISWNYLIPAFFLATAAVLAAAGFEPCRSHVRGLVNRLLCWLAIAVLTAPLIAFATFRGAINLGCTYAEVAEPRRELAQAVNRAWRDAFGLPLRVVASTGAWGHGIAFHASDAPSDFTWFDSKLAPWVTQQRLARDGLAAVCVATDQPCVAQGQALATGETHRIELTLARSWLGYTSAPTRFVAWLIPPTGLGR